MPDSHSDHSDDAEQSGSTTIRLQKAMAAAGVGSRRHCEELIEQGRVEVDREVVLELGTMVDPERQEIRVDGQKIAVARKIYFLVNKPVGYLSTNFDPSGRPRVIDLLPPTKERLFTVGRLDLSSEGLMLVTNDGALAQQLTHPRYGIEKTYLAQVAGEPTPEVLDKLTRGVHLAEGVARCVRATIRSTVKHSTMIEIVLAEGKNREIRRILAKVGHKVLTLRRIAIGGLKLKDLKPGEFRRLFPSEVKLLTNRAPAPKKTRRRTVRRTPEGTPSVESRRGVRGAGRESDKPGRSTGAVKKGFRPGSPSSGDKSSQGRPAGGSPSHGRLAGDRKAAGGKKNTGKFKGFGKSKGSGRSRP